MRNGGRPLDEFELMGHYEHWREDIALGGDLGLNAMRWGAPWYKLEPEPGKFDWSWTDQVLPYMVEELKINPIVDLMHYGCPFWLEREFANKKYPDLVARYAAAFTERYKGLVSWYTPLNEPIINALMCGMRGLWPPYLKGDRGYIRLMIQLARGIIKTTNAIKSVQPDSTLVFVEATGMTRTARKDLAILAREEQHRGYLCFDLITGRIADEHLLFSWLIRNGVSPDDLEDLVQNAIELDVLGMNFYPQWSTKLLYIDKRGKLAFQETEPEGHGFKDMIRDYYERYKVPIMITETASAGSVARRRAWLHGSVAEVRRLRRDGVPVVGYTWWPMFGLVGWAYRQGAKELADYVIQMGLWDLRIEGGQRRRVLTPLVDEYRQFAMSGVDTIGGRARFAA